MLYASILVVLVIHYVDSRSQGPPSQACSTITPQHDENSASDCTQNCPYSLQVVSINDVSISPLRGTVGYVSASDVFGIDVVASGENSFRGLAVQSRASTSQFSGNAAFQGGFENSESDSDWQLITCNMNTNGTAAHTSNSDKSQVSLYWIPPVQSTNVTLWFTIVQGYSIFYVQMEGLRMVPAVYCSQMNFCQNNGMCIEANGNFTCNCASGFTGQNCETSLDPCNPNPCGSSGTCIANGESYFCTCSDGETVATPCVNPTSTTMIMSSSSSSVVVMTIATDVMTSTSMLASTVVTMSTEATSLVSVTSPFAGSTSIATSSAVLIISTVSIQPTSTAVSPTSSPNNPLPLLELLSPQPIRIYGRRLGTFAIQINATVTNEFGLSVKANFSLLNVSLISSTDGIINVNISSYDANSGQLVLIAPSEFYDSYVNATYNTSYFEITLASPISSLTTSITFSAEYLDILSLLIENERNVFVIGENLSMTCITIPPNIPVTWEVNNGNEFVEITGARIQYDPPLIRTVLQLTNLSLNDTSGYQCRGTGRLANETVANTINVLPDSLIIQVSYMIGEENSILYLVNRSAFLLPSSLGQNSNFRLVCIGLLGDNDTEVIADTINSTAVGFRNDFYEVFGQPLDNSGDFIAITFFQFLFSFTGNYTCHSRSSGSERTVFVANNPFGALAILLSPSTVQVALGEDAVFVYRIALADDQDVINSVEIAITNADVSAAEISTIAEQGNDIYHVIFSNVNSFLNQAEFVLQFNEVTISSTATIIVLPTNVSVVPDQFAVSSVGDNVTLTCTPDDTTQSIDWYRGTQLLTANTKYMFSPTVQRYMLTITNVQLNDSDSYYCALADSEIRNDLKIEVIVIEDPVVMILNDVQLPPAAVVNYQPPSTITLMCAGINRFRLAASNPVLPNPVVPGYYSEIEGGATFSVAAFNNLIVLTIGNINGLPSTLESFNCTSLESSAVAKLFYTDENLLVVSLVEEMEVLYGELFTISYTVASSSNGTDNVLNETLNFFIQFEISMTAEPVNLNLTLLSIVTGNQYQLTIPSATFATSGNYRLTAEAFGGEIYSSATVSVTTILPSVSAIETVYELVGRPVRLECNLSLPGSSVVPTLPFTWYRFDDAPLSDAQFESEGSQYMLLLESVNLNDADTYVCAFFENESTIASDQIELTVFKNEINIGYADNILIPSGAIINQFSINNRTRRDDFKIKRNVLPNAQAGVLSLDCFAVTGQENPYWEVSNNLLYNGTISSNLTLQSEDIQATISVVPVSTYVTVIIFDVFPSQLSGTYTCKSSPDGPNSSVLITTNNPFIQALVPSPLRVSQCELVDLLFQAAWNSDGTVGSNTIEIVQIEQFRNGLSVENSTSSPSQQTVTKRFTAISSRLGSYFAYLPEDPNVRDSVEIVVLYPSATLLNDRDVISLRGSNVTLGCIPSNQNHEVRWVFYRDDETSVVLSPNRRIEAKRLAIQDDQLIFEPPGLYHQITIVNASLDDIGTYSCELLPNCSDPFAVAYNMTLTIVPEEANIGYDGSTLLPSGTVINNFIRLDNIGTSAPTTPPPSRRRSTTKQKRNIETDGSFQLECITVMGQENPYWEVSNNTLYNGIITPNLTLAIGETQATIFIIQESNYRTIISFSTFYPQLSGDYTCRSSPNGSSSSVLITTQNPFIHVLTPTPLNVFQCEIVSVVFYAVLNSDGLSNPVDTITFELFQNGESIDNSSHNLVELQSSLQTFQINIIASSFRNRQYYLYLPIEPSQRDSFEITVQYPTLSLNNDESITVLRGSVVSFECIPSNTTFPVRWIFYSPDGTTSNIFSSIPDNSDRFSKRQTNAPGFAFEIGPPGLFNQLTVYDVPLTATGIFSCEIVPPCPDDIVIAQNTSLTVEPACDELFDVFLWPKTPASSTVMFRCADIHPSFRFGPYVTRLCGEGERWNPINFTQCTVRNGSTPLLTVSVILQESDESMEMLSPAELQHQIMNDFGYAGSVMVTVQFEEDQNEYLIFILIELPAESINMTELLALQTYFNSPEHYGRAGASLSATLTLFEPNDVCYCVPPSAVSDSFDDSGISDSTFNIVDVCVGPAVSPCICSTTGCRCKNPAYSGNGTVCARDSDEDTLPDVDLGCDEVYCEKDLCPLMQSLLPDGTQDTSVCKPVTSGDLSCPEVRDEYSLTWPAIIADSSVTISCLSGTGSATRFCDSSGNWEPSNVRACRSYEYIVVAEEAQALSMAAPELVAEMSTNIIDSLVAITEPVNDTSVLPLDLGTVVDILDAVISTSNSSGAIEQEEFVNGVLQVYNNVLGGTNTPGWMDLQQINRTQSQLLLLNAEQFSFQWASTLNVSENRTIISDNIVISAEAVNVSNSEDIMSDVMWPTPGLKEQVELFKSTVPFASVLIPGDLIQRRGMSSASRVALIANTAYRNFVSILPTSVNANDQRGFTQAVSLILSSQVTPLGLSSTSVNPSSDDPVVLTFEYSMNNSGTNLRCGFWDFELEQGSDIAPGGWSSVGLSVKAVDDGMITCSSTHLTSFAVLVDVSGGSQDVSDEQKNALSVVTYIGASISLVCLILSIILFIVYRNSLLKGLHNFIHLNLTIALALALLVFVTGIETATGSDGGCVFVAFLLHYFFTTVFTWMLCEGIMLYFLLVKVFNTGLGQRKLFYLAIGWGIPIPIVVIAVGIAHDQYGTDEYCWISTDEGAIWAFVVPMLVIIIANICILVLVLRAIYKSKQSKISSEKSSKITTAIAILKATMILLPLLGITWVFGILAVNEESVAFAWIFTILNSFQGVFIFVLHVLRNEKVKGKIKSYIRGKGKYTVTTTSQSSTSTRFKTTKSNKGFTTKVKVKIDEEIELGSKGPLDDSVVEPNMYVNPEMVEAVDPNDEKPLASNGSETKNTST